MKLSDKKWRPFLIGELFTRIVSTKGKTTAGLEEGEDVPYIAASRENNGYARMCGVKEHPEWVSEGNCIVFVQLGDGAAGIAHYEPFNFIGMSGKTSCGYIDGKLNRYNGIFIAKALSANKAIYSHGHSWTGRRLLSSKVLLPATEAGEPDYQFMEDYIREMMRKKYQSYLKFVPTVTMTTATLPDAINVEAHPSLPPIALLACP